MEKEILRDAEVLLGLAEKIISECRPYLDYGEDGDETPNEVYTMADFQINAYKFREKYAHLKES